MTDQQTQAKIVVRECSDGRWGTSALPPRFNVRAWIEDACKRSGVTFAITDPVALAKLRVLTQPDAEKAPADLRPRFKP